MTKQDFITYLNAPEKLNGHSIGDLEMLVKEYPYFQAGRMLYLKNLHNQNSIDYEKNLHITSAYVPNGKVLYNLIKTKPVARVEIAPPVLPHSKSVKDLLPKLESVFLLREVPMNTKAERKDEFDELQILEKEMLREAYRTSVTIDLPDVQKTKGGRKETVVEKARIPNLESRTYSFNDWLKVINGQIPDSAIQEKTLLKEKKNEIIDNFILEQTARSEPKPKTEFYSAEAMAKKSILDNETFVSETLATIYLRQGNLPKAHRAYEILLVKYPEKFHIFAPLLEKIKNLMEGQKGK